MADIQSLRPGDLEVSYKLLVEVLPDNNLVRVGVLFATPEHLKDIEQCYFTLSASSVDHFVMQLRKARHKLK